MKMIESSVFYQIIFILRILSMVLAEENVIGYKENTEKIPILPFFQENSDESFWCDNWDSFPNGRSNTEAESINGGRRKIKSQDEDSLRNNYEGKIFGKEYFVEFPFDDMEPRVEKKFDFLKSKYPSSGYFKRKPGFRSWGGKRSSSQVNEDLEYKSKEDNNDEKMVLSKSPKSISLLDAEKRTRFSSWGGKRDDVEGQNKNNGLNFPNEKTNYENPSDEVSKRSWSDPEFYDAVKNQIHRLKYRTLYNQDLFKKFAPKRPKFQSWGGKRSSPQLENVPGIFYFRYLPTGIQFDKTLNADEKTKFFDWDYKKNNEIYNDISKRAFHTFNSWGGKRNDDYTKAGNTRPRPFNSWGGKRDGDKGNIFFMPPKHTETSNSSEDMLSRKKRDQLHSHLSKNVDQPKR